MYSDEHEKHSETASGFSIYYLGMGIKFHGRHICEAFLSLTVFTRIFVSVSLLFVCLKVKISFA